MFFEDKGAVFFSSIEEMVGKVKFLLKRPEEIARISNSGYLRVVKDKHSVVDRAYQFTKMVERCDRFNFNNSIDNTKPKLL